MGNKKLQVWLPLIMAIVMIGGMYFGYRLGGQGGTGKSFFGSRNNSPVQQALDLIRLKYVDSVHLDSLETSAIEEMVGKLDPHSVYYPPVELKEANEDLAGMFYGIGVEFSVFNDTINVIYVNPGGPGDKAGLQIGDKLIKVNDSLLTGSDFSTDKIKQLIRGEKGSKAVLDVLRGKQIIKVDVARGAIPVPAVDASYMVDAVTGYIRLNKFTETSYEEFMQALEQLQKQGLKQLVLDLRGNGGGLMDEAVDMADEFLDGDKLIVYTEGVNSKYRPYKCKRDGLFETGKLEVLVDELSASASEVLAGALQDWCRAKIIGRRTFGKGLVQEQYLLDDGSALRLTVARYFTPLGRSIQRSYEKGKKVYMDELWQRYSNGELLYADSNKVKKDKIYITGCKDTVYGGGGIMPDVFVPIDTSGYSREVNKFIIEGGFNDYVYHFYLMHRQELDHFNSAMDFEQHFAGIQAAWDGLVKYASSNSVDLSNLSSKDKDELQKRLMASLARFKWRNTGYLQVINADDPAFKRAMEEFKKN